MTIVEPKRNGAHGSRRHGAGARGTRALLVSLGLLLGSGVGSRAGAAIVIGGGPTYSPPGGGSCAVSGRPSAGTGATLTCTGLSIGATNHLYIGLKVNSSTFGDAMDNTTPAGSAIFRFNNHPASNQIQYTGTTQIYHALDTSQNSGIPIGFQSVSTRTTVTFTGSGTKIDDATTQGLSGSNGDVRALWQLAANSVTVTVLTEAFNGSSWVVANSFFDGTNTRDVTDKDINHVDIGFYYSSCGDGVTDVSPGNQSPGGEQCDAAGSNGNPASCCDSACQYMSGSTVCRASAGVCDNTDFCTGSSTACADGKVTGVCRSAAGVCDVAESCDGVNNNCPANAFLSSSTVCRGSAGVCDAQENCTGSSAPCPADAKLGTTTICRGAAGVCDAVERCPGNSDNCPADVLIPSGTVCRGTAGVCDVAEACTGASTTCPADAFQPTSATCRMVAGACDVAENCTGTGAACPADGFIASGTECRAAAGACDIAETCTGTAAACPSDAVKASTVECRAVAGVCDVSEFCTGSAAACPLDVFQANTVECRATLGVCDPAENCTGFQADCPADAKQPTSVVCRASVGLCDVTENCDGLNAPCPPDQVKDSNTLCRAASDVCDVPENCNGIDTFCPADGVASDSTPCRAAAGVCDLVDNCDGANKACPVDQKSTDVCRPVAGICDTQEVCDGVNNDCPSDVFQASTVTCRAVAGDCDVAENCTGSAAACPSDGFKASTVVCRAASETACDVAESCTGSSNTCPADTVINEGQGCVGTNNNTCLNTCRSGVCQVETQPSCCGNGIAEAGESCDDGNQSITADVCPTDPSDPNKCTYGTLVRGERKNPTKDKYGCQVEWKVANPNNLADKFGLPDRDQTCQDGDPACDFDGAVNGSCRFQVVACVNTDDASLTCLQPGNGLSSIVVKPLPQKIANLPGIGATYLADINLVSTALTPPGNLHDPQGADGYNGVLPLPQGLATHKDICSAAMNLDVFVAAVPKDKAKRRLTIQAKSKDNSFPRPKAKTSKLRLLCIP